MGWTDCEQSLSLGTVLKGTSWGRPNDRIGAAGVIEGLSAQTRAYFAAGGFGILIGDDYSYCVTNLGVCCEQRSMGNARASLPERPPTSAASLQSSSERGVQAATADPLGW